MHPIFQSLVPFQIRPQSTPSQLRVFGFTFCLPNNIRSAVEMASKHHNIKKKKGTPHLALLLPELTAAASFPLPGLFFFSVHTVHSRWFPYHNGIILSDVFEAYAFHS